MAFKDEVSQDRAAVFLDLDFYGETHEIEGKEVVCLIDDDDGKIGGGKILGVSENQRRLFAREEDLPRRRGGGATLTIDGIVEVIDDWKVDGGMAEIILKKAVAE